MAREELVEKVGFEPGFEERGGVRQAVSGGAGRSSFSQEWTTEQEKPPGLLPVLLFQAFPSSLPASFQLALPTSPQGSSKAGHLAMPSCLWLPECPQLSDRSLCPPLVV